MLDHAVGDASEEPRLDAGATAVVAGLVGRHIRRPTMHALDAAVFLGSLAIVWLGLSPAHT
jgi:hypothetical protein